MPAAVNAGYYARIVAEHAVKRRLIEAGTRIVQLGYSADGEAAEIAARAFAEVEDAAATVNRHAIRPIRDVVYAALHEAEHGTEHGVSLPWADLDELLERARAMTPHIPREYLLRRRTGRPYNKSGFSSNWQRLMTKHVAAGGERFTFHDLRSVSADGAETDQEAQARLGHSSVETTKRFYRRGVTKARPRS